MKRPITQPQLALVREFLHGHRNELTYDLLDSLALHIGLPPSQLLHPGLRFLDGIKSPLFVQSAFEPSQTLSVLKAFRDGAYPLLLIRVEPEAAPHSLATASNNGSECWQCFHRHQDGKIQETTNPQGPPDLSPELTSLLADAWEI